MLVKPVDSNRLEALLHRHLGLVSSPPSPALPSPRDTTVASDLAVVDMELGARLANGSASLARELLNELVASLPETQDKLRAALVTGDPEALLDVVHALNGACRYCGAPELALLAETLETRLRSRGMADVDTLVEDLFEAIERLHDWQAKDQEAPSSTTIASASSASSLKDK